MRKEETFRKNEAEEIISEKKKKNALMKKNSDIIRTILAQKMQRETLLL